MKLKLSTFYIDHVVLRIKIIPFKYTPHLLRNIKNQGNVTIKYNFPLFCLAVNVF